MPKKTFVCKKGRIDTKIHDSYFYVKEIILNSDEYLKFCDGNEISKVDFLSYCDNILNGFIENHKDFYKWKKQIEKHMHVDIKKYCQYDIDTKLFLFCQSNQTNLQFFESNAKNRLYIHNMCDLIMVDHISNDIDGKRCVIINKTDKTNLKTFGEIKENPNESSRKQKTYTCTECYDDVARYEAFVSPYFQGVFCEYCVETEYEGTKFEPL